MNSIVTSVDHIGVARVTCAMQRRTRWYVGIATLSLAIASGAVLAQKPMGIIQGKVVDARTGKNIRNAKVTVSGIDKAARTGKTGNYIIQGIPAGTYTVRCSARGYKPVIHRAMTMSAGKSLTRDCRLQALVQTKTRTKSAKRADIPAREEVAERRAASPVVNRAGSAGYGRGRGGVSKRKRKYKTSRLKSRPRPRPRPTRPIMVGPRPQPEHNTENYEKRDENGFKSPMQSPLSTFSIDVDTASYANIRRFIEQQHRLPPKDAVKIEEMINYFTYDYKSPTGQHPFSVDTEISIAPWNDAHRLVRIGLQGKKLATDTLPASNLVFLLDVSGSMNSPNKLPLLKSAFSLLVSQLRAKDRVAIVVYAGAAGLVLPSTSGKHKPRILAAIDQLRAGGSTAGAQGIQLAYQIARQNFMKGGNNRVILATDGDFNVGVSSDGELVRTIEQKRKQGVFLTVLGFGTGNYQDAKMEKLADKGNGNHAYIDSILEAKKVLVSEMGGTLFTIAKDVKLQIEFNPTKVKGYRLIGYENRMLAAQDFNNDKKDAGELGSGHSVTALYEIIPAGSSEKVPGGDQLKYQKVAVGSAAASNELMTVKLRYKQPNRDKSRLIVHPVKDGRVALSGTSDNFRFAAAVAEFGMLLSGSKHAGTASYKSVLTRARSAKGKDRAGYRDNFITLVRKAKTLAGQ